MPTVRIYEATAELRRDDIGQCATCRELASEGEKYCPYCKDYWRDIENGLFDYDEEWG